ncbi:MAG: hypothetical protein KAJ42_10965, partial [Gemmatimonadetes bacterium]|nr:hypothetical protein [Gemmatimonadota bacterium]
MRVRFAAFVVASGLVVGCATAGGPERGSLPGLTPGQAAWVEGTMASLSLREEVGQLLIPWIPGSYASTSSPDFLELAGWVEDLGVGGVSISIGLPHSYAAKLNELQALARVPLLVTADFENGGPGMRINHSY